MTSDLTPSLPDSSCFDLVGPGIWRFQFGSPETITPTGTRHFQPAAAALAALPSVNECPLQVTARTAARGCQVHLPLEKSEQPYGLGLQLLSFQQRGLKKTLRVNADPLVDSGDSHALVSHSQENGQPEYKINASVFVD